MINGGMGEGASAPATRRDDEACDRNRLYLAASDSAEPFGWKM
jgi:hypothetical protein